MRSKSSCSSSSCSPLPRTLALRKEPLPLPRCLQNRSSHPKPEPKQNKSSASPHSVKGRRFWAIGPCVDSKSNLDVHAQVKRQLIAIGSLPRILVNAKPDKRVQRPLRALIFGNTFLLARAIRYRRIFPFVRANRSGADAGTGWRGFSATVLEPDCCGARPWRCVPA